MTLMILGRPGFVNRRHNQVTGACTISRES